mgnify:CR=1 FL=1
MNKQLLIKLATVKLALDRRSQEVLAREEALRNDPLVKAIEREEQRTGLYGLPPMIQAQRLRNQWKQTGETPLYTPHKNPRMIPPPINPRKDMIIGTAPNSYPPGQRSSAPPTSIFGPKGLFPLPQSCISNK